MSMMIMRKRRRAAHVICEYSSTKNRFLNGSPEVKIKYYVLATAYFPHKEYHRLYSA
jgi:hypothetical protein